MFNFYERLIRKDEELDKLAFYLSEHGYNYKRRTPNEKDSRNSVVVYDENGKYLWDAICFYGSYGFEDGLLEIYGNIVTDEEREIDNVVGYLTAEDIINRLEANTR